MNHKRIKDYLIGAVLGILITIPFYIIINALDSVFEGFASEVVLVQEKLTKRIEAIGLTPAKANNAFYYSYGFVDRCEYLSANYPQSEAVEWAKEYFKVEDVKITDIQDLNPFYNLSSERSFSKYWQPEKTRVGFKVVGSVSEQTASYVLYDAEEKKLYFLRW